MLTPHTIIFLCDVADSDRLVEVSEVPLGDFIKTDTSPIVKAE